MGKGVVAVTALHVSMAPPTLDCESYAQVSANNSFVQKCQTSPWTVIVMNRYRPASLRFT